MGLRILLASDYYPPYIGGAHRQTRLLGQELYSRGHTVAVATAWQPNVPEVEDDGGVCVYRLKQLRSLGPGGAQNGIQRHQPPFPDPLTVLALRRLIRRFRPDVVHAYGWFSYSCAAALLGQEIPLLISSRDYGYSCATRTLVYRGEKVCNGPQFTKCVGCAGQLYGLPKGVIATTGVYLGRALLRRKVRGIHNISSYVQQIVERDFLGHTGRIMPQRIIPSFREDRDPADESANPQIRPYLRQLPAEPFILFVGALRRVKGIPQLLAAYERLDQPPPLVLLGTVETDTPRTFPPGVVVVEKAPHAAVIAAWDRSLFGVFPSILPEPLGSVVYEGMSRGRAVIGTVPGGHTDMIIPGQTGLLVPLGDVNALVGAMQQLLGDPALRERLGENAREHAKLFTAAVSVPRFEQFYYDLIQGRQGMTNAETALPLAQH